MNTLDKKLIHDRFAANLARYNRLATVQRAICRELYAALEPFLKQSRAARVLEIGAGTGFLTSIVAPRLPSSEWFVNDLVPESEAFLRRLSLPPSTTFLWGDAEEISLPCDIDLIISSSAVQWFADLPGFVARCRESLSDGGTLAFTTFGPSNFTEIREQTGEGLEYYTLSGVADLLIASGFEVLHSSQYRRQMLFSSPVEVLHHIKATGVNGLGRTRWTSRRLKQFEEGYRDHHTTIDGNVTLTYHPLIIVARKR